MIVAHLSDLHLGHRAFDRSERGRNVRERDVAEAFHRAVEALVELRPEVILVAGDVLDRPDPPAAALVVLTRGLEVLGAELPDVPVLMVAGARDIPAGAREGGALGALESFPQVHTATVAARSIPLRDGSVHVCMVPHREGLRRAAPRPEPDSRAEHNLLLMYGRVVGRGGRRAIHIDPDAWDYVALGSEHAVRRVAPGVHYSGSLERVGPSPWAEAAVEKGFLTRDLEARRTTFHRVPGRAVVELAPIRARPGAGEALRARVREVTAEVPGGIDGKIVHIPFRGIALDDLLALQGETLTALRERALHVSLDIEDPRADPDLPVDLRSRIRAILDASGGTTPEQSDLLERLLPPGPFSRRVGS